MRREDAFMFEEFRESIPWVLLFAIVEFLFCSRVPFEELFWYSSTAPVPCIYLWEFFSSSPWWILGGRCLEAEYSAMVAGLSAFL